MVPVKQQILPLELLPAFDAKDFILSSANEEAYLWLMRWPNWPNRCLAIYGDKGCGKTHLSKIYQTNTQATYLKGQEFNTIDLETLLKEPNLFILDDAHLIEKEEKLFHFYNHLVLTKGSLLFLSLTPPAHWGTHLPDLRSRLHTIPALKIHPPDEALLTQVIQKLFSDLQLKVDEGVVSFLLNHMERSFESAHFWVETLNVWALTQKRSITIPLVREILLKQELAEILLP
jgi:chromosomal replication initiation ATPase DnaA